MRNSVPLPSSSASDPHLPTSAPSLAASLRALTPARVALGRTGVSLATRDLLDFQASHARARDAVHARLDSAALAAEIESGIRPEVLRLHSAANSRSEFLRRPDLGRRLNETSRTLLAEQPTDEVDLAFVIADGLSALAVERHVPTLLQELLPRLPEWWLAPISIVEQGRVAIGDEIGAALHAQISVVLIGERPGLNSPDSLGVYITYGPRPGRTDAERDCISNVRPEGLGYAQAAAEIACILNAARRFRLTGVALQQASRQIEKAKL